MRIFLKTLSISAHSPTTSSVLELRRPRVWLTSAQRETIPTIPRHQGAWASTSALPSDRNLLASNVAVLQVVEYRINKVAASDSSLMQKGSFFKNHAIKTKYGFDRVVEDLIQESMSKGDFTNLNGTGKPLSNAQAQNPYVDFTQHKINKILLDNGFTPEWIMLQKEIREGVDELKESLMKERCYLGPLPFDDADEKEWAMALEQHGKRVETINKKIDKYNFIVPVLTIQMVQIRLKEIAEGVLASHPAPDRIPRTSPQTEAPSDTRGFLSFFSSWL